MSHPWLKVVALPIAVFAIYFLVPVDADRAPVGVVTGILLSAGGLAGAVLIVVSEVRGARRLSGLHLILVLEIVLVVFSFTYYLIESNSPGQFGGLTTRLDALYFSTATSATVGFGDVHATGQVARGVVTLHMIFNIVFIAAVVNLAKEAMTERRAAQHATQAGPPDSDA
ncbi:MAG: potassium channel family protein [Nocardioides sp.]